MVERDRLRDKWKELYSQTLPSLARQKDPAQDRWPVTLDHCFARIILDNTVGNGEQQWDKVIAKPAVRSMNESQLIQAIELANDIIEGKVDLRDLDEISLRCRNKNEAKYGRSKATGEPPGNSSKRKHDDLDSQAHDQNGDLQSTTENLDPKDETKSLPSSKRIKSEMTQSTLPFATESGTASTPQRRSKSQTESLKPNEKSAKEYSIILKRIQNHVKLTPYRKRLYTVLLSVPTGRYTTYAAMSAYLQSSARAVGNGMRNNPFAPEVPCHRVLAADGSIGGFGGDWGTEGKHARKKVDLLRSEGVKFDGKGKVVGEPFRGFHEFDSMT